MDREWRSQSWRANHPLSFSKRLQHSAHRFITPLRKTLGRLALPKIPQYLDLAAIFKASQHIEGDYCEFGIYTGRSFVHAYAAITAAEQDSVYARKTRFYAFDSFCGLPEPDGVDKVYPQFAKGGLAATKEEFVTNLVKHGVDVSKVRIIPGWYSDVLSRELAAQIGLKKVAIAMIDCDLYASTVPVLDFLTELLTDGAILIFDDWHLFRCHPELGPQSAFNEWCCKHQLRLSPFPPVTGSFQKAFIFHRPMDNHLKPNLSS